MKTTLLSLIGVFGLMAAACGSTQKPAAAPIAKPPAMAVQAPAKAVAPTAAELEQIQVTLRRVHFALNSAKLVTSGRAALKEAAEKLRSYSDLQISVVGHADERGSDDYNQELARRRAEAVVAELQKHGIDSSRLQADSRGNQQPLVSGSNAHAWAANRRVEFRIAGDRAKVELQDGVLIDDQGRPLTGAKAGGKASRRVAAAE